MKRYRAHTMVPGESWNEEGRDPFQRTNFRLLAELGGGGMGEILRVEHRHTGRCCVAKIIRREFAAEERDLDRFRLEAQTLGRLDHPHIVSILGAGVVADGRPYFVTEDLGEKTLSDVLCEAPPLSLDVILEWTEQLLSAVSAVHALGIIHRDIKPSNVVVVARPEGVRWLKLLDFGLAKVIERASEMTPEPLSLPTEEGMVVGTRNYLSPEMRLGRSFDERADLFAVGRVLEEMTTRVFPPVLPPSVREVLVRALRENPKERYQDADHFRLDVARVRDLLRREGSLRRSASPLKPSPLKPPPLGRHAVRRRTGAGFPEGPREKRRAASSRRAISTRRTVLGFCVVLILAMVTTLVVGSWFRGMPWAVVR